MKQDRTWKMALAVTVLLSAGLAACGNKGVKTCDKPERYQQATVNDRVRTPEDLDDLDTMREMPVPEANPAQERPPGSPCIDLPPRILGSG